MDVSHLNSTPNPTNGPSTPSLRSRPSSTPFTTSAPASESAADRPAAPATPAAPVGDRLERTPELSRRLAELRADMEREAQARNAHVEAIRRQVEQEKTASHDTLMRAAAGILHGELYFLATPES
jgi:hypothetical protein